MRPLRILKRESPLLLAREALWRTRKAWNKTRLPARLERLATFQFRSIPYYDPSIQNLSGRSRALLLAFADEIRLGRYPFLSYATVQLGTLPKWNRDFVSGTEWPYRHYEGHECVRNDGSDVKVPYELSRLQFLPILGKAYLLTGADSYRQTAKDLLWHWIRSNPVSLGVNWTIAMEAGLRAISICFLLNLLSPFKPEEQSWLAAVTRSLSEHLLYIEAHLEFSHLLTSNHYLSNLVSLYCLSLFLEGKGLAQKRVEYLRRIEAEMAKQVYADGGDYEASTGYQVLVTQLFTTALLLTRAEGSTSIAPAFLDRLRTMFLFLNALANSSGELPHVGDCDDGRVEFLMNDIEQMLLLPLQQRNSLRVSGLLEMGQRLFGEGTVEGEDALWYGLSSRTAIPYALPPVESGEDHTVRILPQSGIGLLRQGSADLLFFAIPNGIYGKGSHTHNDKLSFVLRVAGRDLLCDSGTASYTRDVATRNLFRSTSAHNTLRIDAVEQNRIPPGPRGLFALGNEAAVRPIERGDVGGLSYLRASHSGYRSLGVLHTRTIRALDDEQSLVIEDQLEGHGLHDFELNFQLAPGCIAELAPADNGVSYRVLGDPQIHITVSGPVPLQSSIDPTGVSTTFNVSVPSFKLRFSGRAAVPARIITVISWTSVTRPPNGLHSSASGTTIRYALSEEVSIHEQH
jgi:Heparinase II/III-like protein/Heparinase II/III N-terminus